MLIRLYKIYDLRRVKIVSASYHLQCMTHLTRNFL